jgi:hypothetical protein
VAELEAFIRAEKAKRYTFVDEEI